MCAEGKHNCISNVRRSQALSHALVDRDMYNLVVDLLEDYTLEGDAVCDIDLWQRLDHSVSAQCSYEHIWESEALSMLGHCFHHVSPSASVSVTRHWCVQCEVQWHV